MGLTNEQRYYVDLISIESTLIQTYEFGKNKSIEALEFVRDKTWTPFTEIVTSDGFSRAYNAPLVFVNMKELIEDDIKNAISFLSTKENPSKKVEYLTSNLNSLKVNLQSIQSEYSENIKKLTSTNVAKVEFKNSIKKFLDANIEVFDANIKKYGTLRIEALKTSQFKSFEDLINPQRKKTSGVLYDAYKELRQFSEKLGVNISEVEKLFDDIKDYQDLFGLDIKSIFPEKVDYSLARARVYLFSANQIIGKAVDKLIKLIDYAKKWILFCLEKLGQVSSKAKTFLVWSQKSINCLEPYSKALKGAFGILIQLPDVFLDSFSFLFAYQDYQQKDIFSPDEQKKIETQFFYSLFALMGGIVLLVAGLIATAVASLPAIIFLVVLGIILGTYELITGNDMIGQFGAWLFD